MALTIIGIDDGEGSGAAALTVTLPTIAELVVGVAGNNGGVIELGGNYQSLIFEASRTDSSADALTAFKLEGQLYSGGNWMTLCDTWSSAAVTRNLIYSSGNIATLTNAQNFWAMCDVRGVQQIRFKAIAADAAGDVVLVVQGTVTPAA